MTLIPLQSAPSDTQEMATASLNGMLGASTNGMPYKVVNSGVRKENGKWIATADIELLEPDAEEEKQGGDDSSVVEGPEAIAPDAADLSEKVKDDFNGPEPTAYNVDADKLAADRLAEQKLQGLNEAEMKRLRDEIEARLKESPLPDNAVKLPEEAVNPAPAS